MQRSREFGHVQCDCCKPTNNCREVWLPAFQLPMFSKCDAVPNEICWTCLFQESIPAMTFWNSKHPLPTRSLRFLRASVRSTSSALCLYYACKRSHPFVEDSGFVFDAGKQKVLSVLWSSRVVAEYWNVFFFFHLPCRLLQCVEIEL